MELDELLKKLKEIEDIKDWTKYDMVGPTKDVLEFSKKLICELNAYLIFPHRIAPTVEEGMFFLFKKDNKSFNLEICNDGDVGFIINDDTKKKILDNKDIGREEIIDHIVKFLEKEVFVSIMRGLQDGL
jgi:hypothetical protein